MLHETFPITALNPALSPSQTNAELTVYARSRLGFPADNGERWAMLILPGGAYGGRSTPEAEPIAMAFLAKGIQCFVLDYSLAPDRYPRQLLETAAAIAWIREHREKYGISRVAVSGFSAGGHLAGCISNLWHLPMLSETLGVPSEQLRPDASVFGYPAICMEPNNICYLNLLGHEATEEELALLSLERSVTPQNPPAFLWATDTDEMVPVMNTLKYAEALLNVGCTPEVHLFPKGPHITSTGTTESAIRRGCINPHAAHWTDLCAEWLGTLK